MKKDRYIYIMLSRTCTKFARCIRKFGDVKYTHASISLDADMSNVYGFARPQHNAVLLGRLVKESLERYTLHGEESVPVVVLAIPVTKEQYDWVRETIDRIYSDPEYMYNLFSVLSYPITKGFACYKSYTCVEFVVTILKRVGYSFENPAYQYKPDDLLRMFADYVVFRGDVREVLSDYGDTSYFAPMSRAVFVRSTKAVFRLSWRSLKGLLQS